MYQPCLEAKSAKEIMFGLFTTYQFTQLDSDSRKPYMDKVLKLNGSVRKG